MDTLKVDRMRLEDAVNFASEQLKDKPRTQKLFLDLVNSAIIVEPKEGKEEE